MFTADHQRAAAELVRVCRPGGTIALASWTPGGFVGQMLKIVTRHVHRRRLRSRPPDGVRQRRCNQLLGARITRLRFERQELLQRFHSPEHFADVFLTHYEPEPRTAAHQLDSDGRQALRQDMIALAESNNRAQDGTFRHRAGGTCVASPSNAERPASGGRQR